MTGIQCFVVDWIFGPNLDVGGPGFTVGTACSNKLSKNGGNVYEALSGWGSGKVLLDIIFKIQENKLIMISNTIEIFFIVYFNTFLQKKMCFATCKKFYIDLWSFLVA